MHLTKAILTPNGRYFPGLSALFLEKRADYPLYQTVESFRLAIASAYRLAQANMAYRRFSFFFKPLYTVFLYPNWHLMILNACSTLHRTEDFRFSIYRSQSIVLSKTGGSLPGRRLIRKSIFEKCSLFAISGRFWTPIYPESPYTTSSSSRRRCSVCVQLPLRAVLQPFAKGPPIYKVFNSHVHGDPATPVFQTIFPIGTGAKTPHPCRLLGVFWPMASKRNCCGKRLGIL